MSEEATGQTPETPPAGEGSDQGEQSGGIKFAGKFDTPEALEKGVIELRSKVGLGDLPEGKALVGNGGMYADHQAAEAAYKEYETIMGKMSQAKAPAPPPATDKDQQTGELQIKGSDYDPDGGIEEVLKKAGLAGQEAELTKRFAEDGKLTDEQYASLAKSGYPKGVVNGYWKGEVMAAQQAKMTAITEAAKSVGGSDNLQKLMQNAHGKLSEQETEAFNERMKDPTQIKSVVYELQGRFGSHQAQSNAASLVTSGRSNSSVTSVPKDLKSLKETMDKADRGDPAAIKVFNNMPMEQIAKL